MVLLPPHCPVCGSPVAREDRLQTIAAPAEASSKGRQVEESGPLPERGVLAVDARLLPVGERPEAVAAREAENAKLQLRNAALQAEVEDLRAGGAAIETHARKSLGMVKREETFFLVVNASAGDVGRP